MMLQRVARYLSRLDGVERGEVHDSHSQYFKMTDILVRVSDHFAIKANFPTTLNIVCEGEDFVVTYGNKLIPIKNYTALKQLLKNFAMVSDILAPLAETRRQVRVIEKPVLNPSEDSSNWLYIGDLPDKLKQGARNNVANMKKMSHIK